MIHIATHPADNSPTPKAALTKHPFVAWQLAFYSHESDYAI